MELVKKMLVLSSDIFYFPPVRWQVYNETLTSDSSLTNIRERLLLSSLLWWWCRDKTNEMRKFRIRLRYLPGKQRLNNLVCLGSDINISDCHHCINIGSPAHIWYLWLSKQTDSVWRRLLFRITILLAAPAVSPPPTTPGIFILTRTTWSTEP